MGVMQQPGGQDYSPAHAEFVKLVGEGIGVALLAVFADMSGDFGRVAVVIMAGWFLLFLMINAAEIQGLVTKV